MYFDLYLLWLYFDFILWSWTLWLFVDNKKLTCKEVVVRSSCFISDSLTYDTNESKSRWKFKKSLIWNMVYQFSMPLSFSSFVLNSSTNSEVFSTVSFLEIKLITINLGMFRFFVFYYLYFSKMSWNCLLYIFGKKVIFSKLLDFQLQYFFYCSFGVYQI